MTYFTCIFKRLKDKISIIEDFFTMILKWRSKSRFSSTIMPKPKIFHACLINKKMKKRKIFVEYYQDHIMMMI